VLGPIYWPHINDRGLSSATIEHPALILLLADIEEGLVDLAVIYRVDRLTRLVSDFAVGPRFPVHFDVSIIGEFPFEFSILPTRRSRPSRMVIG
jgi:hypothetical protein